MMKIAKFEKVSYEQFLKDLKKLDASKTDEEIKQIYEEIILPNRATTGSAGYDFHATFDFELEAGQQILIPTGIRAKMDIGWVLMLFPRSSLGFKYRLQLNNTVGIIDSDYYNADNEGHIFLKLLNDSRESKTISVKATDAICQGVFVPFGIVEDDEVTDERTGGIGSTDRKSE